MLPIASIAQYWIKCQPLVYLGEKPRLNKKTELNITLKSLEQHMGE
jgi:hypothetical protein